MQVLEAQVSIDLFRELLTQIFGHPSLVTSINPMPIQLAQINSWFYRRSTDIRQAPQRAQQAQRIAEDHKLKRAYNNSQTALQKKNDSLVQLKKQIDFQQEQMKQLQKDRVMFVRQEREYLRKGKTPPAHLKTTLDNNQKNLASQKENIQSLQSRYRNLEAEYDKIIARLKALE